MADPEVLQQRLDLAEDALDRLMRGESEVEIEYAGRSTKFARANESSLRRYISELKRGLGMTTARRSRKVLF